MGDFLFDCLSLMLYITNITTTEGIRRMSLDSLTIDETAEIKRIVDAGETVLEEIDTLKEGLKDTVDNLAKELDVKPSMINKAIRCAYKGDIHEAQEEMSEMETFLHAAGRM